MRAGVERWDGVEVGAARGRAWTARKLRREVETRLGMEEGTLDADNGRATVAACIERELVSRSDQRTCGPRAQKVDRGAVFSGATCPRCARLAAWEQAARAAASAAATNDGESTGDERRRPSATSASAAKVGPQGRLEREASHER